MHRTNSPSPKQVCGVVAGTSKVHEASHHPSTAVEGTSLRQLKRKLAGAVKRRDKLTRRLTRCEENLEADEGDCGDEECDQSDEPPNKKQLLSQES
jgi:hypothetical protein